MDYEKKDEEFYEFIKKKRDEIKTLAISENEKNNLYQLVDETAQRYEELKISFLENQLFMARLNKIQRRTYQGLEEITSITKGMLSNLEELAKKQKANRKILFFPRHIPFYPHSKN